MFDLFGNFLTRPLILKYAGSIIRHLLTFVSGALVSWGVVKDGSLFISANQEVLVGLLMYALSQGLSFSEKKK